MKVEEPMIKTVVCCDICGTELPTNVVETPFGTIESVRVCKCKEWDVSNVFPYLCETCQIKIDYALIKAKNEVALE